MNRFTAIKVPNTPRQAAPELADIQPSDESVSRFDDAETTAKWWHRSRAHREAMNEGEVGDVMTTPGPRPAKTTGPLLRLASGRLPLERPRGDECGSRTRR